MFIDVTGLLIDMLKSQEQLCKAAKTEASAQFEDGRMAALLDMTFRMGFRVYWNEDGATVACLEPRAHLWVSGMDDEE